MHRRLIITNKKEPDLLYISETTLDSDFQASYHSHPNLEILLIVEGEGKLVTLNRNIDMKKGDIFIINANSKHCEVTKGKCSFYAIGINQLDVFLKEDFKKKIIYFSLSKEDYNSLSFLYYNLMKEVENNQENSDTMIASSFQMIMTIIERSRKMILKKTKQIHGNSIVSAILNIIENYYYIHLDIKDIAKRLSVSKSTLYHCFKKETGKTIIVYKMECQIKEACNLLTITDMSILDIAFAVGFTSPSYFTKTFKSIVGMSPRDYKKKIAETAHLEGQ